MHGAKEAAEEDIAEELLSADETDDEDIADDADEELSAKLKGTIAIAAEAAINRERDFFIRKKGKETGVAYHTGSSVELA